MEYDPNYKKGNAKDANGMEIDDGLDRQVSALPQSITSRFGEVVFAQGGNGYGWWPCQIYDPRQAMDATVRQTAQKYLRSRYLVYFFNCGNMEAIVSSSRSATTSGSNQGATSGSNIESVAHHVNPFAVLPTKMIKSWVTGMSEELYLGRAAKAHGKQRYREFRDAFQMASLEHDKPKRTEPPKSSSIKHPQSHASPIMSADKFVRKEPFLSPSPSKKHLSPTKILKSSRSPSITEGNRKKGKVKKSSIQWYHITIKKPGQLDRIATASSLVSGNDVHPAFASLFAVDETFEENSVVLKHDGDTVNEEQSDKGEVVFSCPLPSSLLERYARLHEIDEKKRRTRSLPKEVSNDSIEPVDQSAKRQRIVGEDSVVEDSSGSPAEHVVVPSTELPVKRKRGRPRKNASI